MKKLTALILTLILTLSVMLTGCSDGSPLDPKNPVELTMWHNYGGEMQNTMDALVEEFNHTVGKDKGIVINVTNVASSSTLNESLELILEGSPGAPDMPDIFTGYPEIAVKFQEKDMLANLDGYMTEEVLDKYVEAFVEEGRLSDGGLYVFPIAKSTEVLYVNMTLFNKFAAETEATEDMLYTFEGLAELSAMYYEWSGGKQFFGSDDWFNFFEVGMAQLGGSIFDGEALSLDGEKFEYIFNTIYDPAAKGGIAVYDGYSSDLSKTGDLICSTGSSAGILFYGDTVTYENGAEEKVDYSILPYPVFENGAKTAIQRGGGLMVSKSDEKKEYAACEFIKWLTASEQNMKFVNETGYLPVTKQAFEEDMDELLDTMENANVKKMLTSVLSMYDEYTFFTAPNYPKFNDDSSGFESKFKELLQEDYKKFLAGEAISAGDTLTELRK